MTRIDITTLQQTIARLRGEGGCPWDKRQTAKSLIEYIRNETEELIAAIEKDDSENTCEELGDVLYLICMITAINADAENFTFSQVVAGINSKLIRRHPHVFAGTHYENEEDLARQWEAIKAEGKKERRESAAKKQQ